ncbi:MAG: hypothetical protein KF768_02355 [Phycisphaeraceae bacterium]|nr:hypothetical protein [Phycisphaeraceae bacterium]
MNDQLFHGSDDRLPPHDLGAPDVPDLHEADRLALDAVVDAGWTADPADPRSAHIASFLSMLAPPPSAVGTDDALIDLTLARVARARRAQAAPHPAPTVEVLALSQDDEDAVEQYIASGFSVASVSAPYRARAQRADDLLSTLNLPTPDSADREALVAQTLSAVQRSVETQERRMVLDPAESAPARGFRISDLVSVAALILIGTAVIGPMVGSVRAFGQRLACTAGFGELAGAFGQYTHDFRDTLPMATASIAGRPWWNVGNPEESNSANLYTLARTNYTPSERLACPTNDRSRRCSKRAGERDWHCIDEVSYSYQNLFARARPKWHEGSARVAILVDRSPVVLLSARKASIDPFSNSPNHGRAGQNALFNDGSVVWLASPVLENGDNIWLPRVIERAIADRACRSRKADPLRGTESPECPKDTFVGP